MKTLKKLSGGGITSYLGKALLVLVIVASCFAVSCSDSGYCTVYFNSNGGTAVETQRVVKGTCAATPKAPTREGYVFVGWCTDISLTTYYFWGEPVTKDVFLYAKWREKTTPTPTPTTQYTVTYDANGATSGTAPVDSNQYSSGDTVTVLSEGTLTKEGYTFAGWNTKADGSGTAYAAGDTFTITKNTMLYAKWLNCIIFSSSDSFSISVSIPSWTGTIQYSTDGNNWTNWTGTSVTSGTDNTLYFKGTDNTNISYTNGSEWVIDGQNVSVSGNIVALLNCDDPDNATMAGSCFHSMFKDQTALVSAASLTLPAKGLTYQCCKDMFYGCTNLTEAPELPATILAKYCYYGMFQGCEKLETPPELPAGKLNEQQQIVGALADSCYNRMFSGIYDDEIVPSLEIPCGLKTAPELPATTLADGCYNSMFDGCTSLTTAPELNATTLTANCYQNMFYGCTSLTTATTLSATTLAQNCCWQMFKGCTNLTTAPTLNAVTLVTQCYYEMFYGCTNLASLTVGFSAWGDFYDNCTNDWLRNVASSGTFTCPSALEQATPSMTGGSTSTIPNGWTVVNP